ncbi:MAG TPA: lysophospholipid acyltransferase family protein [Gemmatales bacterium]|nr:lysophospholipid acyltransferase family protein [Gemmatales bacterium]
MKLRHPGLIKLLGLILSWIIRMWMGTVRTREYLVVPEVLPSHPRNTGRYIFAFWHEGILYMAGRYGHHQNVAILISNHADGEIISQVIRHLGMNVVRGSTSKSGVPALMQMLEASHRGHLAITPDGPRGPRRVAQLGTVYLASRTGFSIVPVGLHYHRAWYAPSWDRFGVPWPFSRAAGIAGKPLVVPPDLSKEELEPYARELERQMNALTEQAKQWTNERSW